MTNNGALEGGGLDDLRPRQKKIDLAKKFCKIFDLAKCFSKFYDLANIQPGWNPCIPCAGGQISQFFSAPGNIIRITKKNTLRQHAPATRLGFFHYLRNSNSLALNTRLPSEGLKI